jgi:hypothetical protein
MLASKPLGSGSRQGPYSGREFRALRPSKPVVEAGRQLQSKQRAALCLADEFMRRQPEYGNRSKILFTPSSIPKSRTGEAGGYRNALLRTARHLTEKILGRSLRNRAPRSEGGTEEVPNEEFLSSLVPFCS